MQNKRLVERVAGNVRAELARRGISQSALAAQLDRSQPFISRRLSARVAFDIAEIAAIADFLGVAPSALISGDASAA